MTQTNADKKKKMSDSVAYTIIRRRLQSAFICAICGLPRGLWIPTDDQRTSPLDYFRLTTK
jgi:hypothetical protein